MTATHTRTDHDRILEQITRTVKEGQKFRYAHHHSDVSLALYEGLASGKQRMASYLKAANPLPQAYPRHLMYFRDRFHMRLAGDKDFMHVLSMKDMKADRYFSHMETILRFCLGQVLKSSYISTPMRYAEAGQKADHYGKKVCEVYFRGRELERIIASIIQVDYTNPLFLRHADIERMSVDVSTPYVATLLQANFNLSHLISSGQLPLLPQYSVLDCNYIYEAGHHIGHELASQLMDAVMIPLQIPRARLMPEVTREVERLAELQEKRRVMQGIHGKRIMNILINDAGAYIPQIIARLHEHFSRGHNGAATPQPVQFVPPKPPEARQLGGNKQEIEAKISQKESVEAVEAGREIIEYLRRMQFGDKAVEEPKIDMPANSGTTDEDEAAKKVDAGRGDDEHGDEMEQQFEVSVGTQQKRLMTLTAIINVLSRGRNVTFSSNAHMKMFLRAAYVKTGGNLGFRVTQLRYVEKGTVKETDQRMSEEMIQDLQIDKERAERDHKKEDREKKQNPQSLTSFMADSKEIDAQKDLKKDSGLPKDKRR